MTKKRITIGVAAFWLTATAAWTAQAKPFNIIHVGGECSTKWAVSGTGINFWDTGQKVGNGVYATWAAGDNNTYPGYFTKPIGTITLPTDQIKVLDANIDNQWDIWWSVSQLATYLDAHCNNANVPGSVYTAYKTVNTSCRTYSCFGKLGCSCLAWNTVQQPYTVDNTQDCAIMTFSGGDNVVRKTLSMYNGRWNVRAIYDIEGTGGGTEIASVLDLVGGSEDDFAMLNAATTDSTVRSCEFQTWLDVDEARSGYGDGYWVYDDTDGHPFYHVVNLQFQPLNEKYSDLLPGYDDGVVAYHSSLGRADVMAFNNTTYNHPQSEYHTPFACDSQGWAETGPNGNYFGHYYGTEVWYPPIVLTHWFMKLYGMAAVAYIGPDCWWQWPDANFCNGDNLVSAPSGTNVGQYCIAGCSQGPTPQPL